MQADVVIVGYGPIGQVLANLLAARGRRVIVLERWPKPYVMPRAVSFDTEAARILAAAGVAGHMTDFGESSGEYEWRDAGGNTLLYSEVSPNGWCGWPDSTSMYQPGLEEALARHGGTLPTLEVLRGHEVTGLRQRGDSVQVEAGELTVTASWVVGCDGANSFVREEMGAAMADRGFSHDWLICDVQLHEPRKFLPNNLQICDPARPRTEVSAGPGHRRWEFMRVPGETVTSLCTRESAWRLLELFDVRQDNSTLDRFAVYTFQAASAQKWRSGRLLIAGDAAHVMPPFAGQGMSSGFRDAINLAWKLDLVLSGAAPESLLDTYEAERSSHVQHAINLSVNLGRIICQTDPEEAADHHAVLLAARDRGLSTSRARSAIQPLDDGFLHLRDGKPLRPAGELMPQGRVARDDRVGFFDELVAPGFVLLTTESPSDAAARDLARLGATVVRIGPGGLTDVDGVYEPFLRAHGPVLVRPDFYIFGAGDAAELAAAAHGLLAG